jgi:hypothetical protein
MRNILVLDEIPAAGIDVLRSQDGFEVWDFWRAEPEDVRNALGTAELFIIVLLQRRFASAWPITLRIRWPTSP